MMNMKIVSAIILLTVLAAPLRANAEMPTGRTAWACEANPVIYPGWWAFKNLGYVGGPATIDGLRTAAPSAHKVGDEIIVYYLAGRELATGGEGYKVLRTTAPISDPTNLSPANIALEFTLPVYPGPNDPAEGYYAAGPYQAHVLPWLTADGSAPGQDAHGNYYPWYMYFATRGNNTGVARSVDGGITFQLVADKNPLFPFEVYQIRNSQGILEWRRRPVREKSKPYDIGGSGSSSAARTTDGVFHLFTTSAAMRNQTVEDLGVSIDEVGHPDGTISDIGVSYATATDGLTFTRKTSQSIGVSSPAARGSGRIIDPRKKDAPNGLYEYIVSRPMVFRDGVMPGTSTPRWRMMLSAHSTTYRGRSLHSDDLINWTWDASPADGTFGLGGAGLFDDQHVAYPSCFRDVNTYHCYYTGNGYGHVNTSPTGIGYCTASALN